MSQATASVASGLVRVTVASGTRRVDLVLPGAVPVAELVPELARSVGLLDPATVYGGYRLVTPEGRELAGDAGLIIQGIEDGGLLTVTAGVDDEPPRVYDDVVEAMTDVVERDLKPWEPASGRRTALSAAGPADGARAPSRCSSSAARCWPRSPPRSSSRRAGRRARSSSPAPSTSPRRPSPSPGWAAFYAAVAGLHVRSRRSCSSGCRWPAPARAPWWPGWSRWSASARAAPS